MDKWLISAAIALAVVLVTSYEHTRKLRKKYETAEANLRAYSMELSAAGKQNTALQLTVEQLEYFKDSVLEDLDNTRKELKIKDKNLKALQQVTSVFTRTDTITLKDTLFKEPTLSIDTLMGDEWYTLDLGLKYPSMIVVKPEFKSKKHIVVSSKKETVNPPKKFFLFRWFQRKMRVIHVDVVEKNPYVQDEGTKYVEIIK